MITFHSIDLLLVSADCDFLKATARVAACWRSGNRETAEMQLLFQRLSRLNKLSEDFIRLSILVF